MLVSHALEIIRKNKEKKGETNHEDFFFNDELYTILKLMNLEIVEQSSFFLQIFFANFSGIFDFWRIFGEIFIFCRILDFLQQFSSNDFLLFLVVFLVKFLFFGRIFDFFVESSVSSRTPNFLS